MLWGARTRDCAVDEALANRQGRSQKAGAFLFCRVIGVIRGDLGHSVRRCSLFAA